MDAHEMTGQNIATLDQPLFDFLNSLEKKGALENTHLIFWSDHGHHHHPLELEKTDYFLETGLPALFYIMP
jgi:arylsulfatase A-like enzyme